MKIKPFFFWFLFLGLSACQTTEREADKSAQKELPNIVFIFTDDQTYTSIRALGNTEIQTPNMDRLVNQGTTFTHAYNMGAWNGAVCVASRAMIISGRSVWRADAFRENWIDDDPVAMNQTWPKLLEANGYKTYMSGKWHVDAPADSIFQKTRHIRPGMPNDQWHHYEMVEKFKDLVETNKVKPEAIMPIGYNRPVSESDDSWSPVDTSFGGFWEGGKHWSEVLRDDAIGFIREAKKEVQPFFMYLAFNAPHDPRQAPQKFLNLYPLDQIALPQSWQAEYPFQNDIGNGPSLRDEALAPFPRTEYATKKHIQEYYALISHLDHQIGLILDELEASGKMDNTYLFFTADHGLAMGRHGLLGKQNLFDHSIRVPLVIAGKDIPKGKKVNADIYLQDVMATSLELAGLDKPNYVEFNSFLNLAKGTESKSAYPSIYGGYIDFQRMIRKDDYKLIVYPKIEKVLLFDLKKDPEELQNLAEETNYKSKVKELFAELLVLQNDLEDQLDLKTMFNKW